MILVDAENSEESDDNALKDVALQFVVEQSNAAVKASVVELVRRRVARVQLFICLANAQT